MNLVNFGYRKWLRPSARSSSVDRSGENTNDPKFVEQGKIIDIDSKLQHKERDENKNNQNDKKN